MMGQQAGAQEQLFYSFNLNAHVPSDHLLRSIDRFLDLGGLRRHLASFYSHTGRPWVDPELMTRMLIVGYCFGIRSERRLCQEVQLNLAYRWFCRLNLEDSVPEHSTFSRNRHGRFRASGTFRWLFDEVVRSCMAAGLVKGEGFAVDASVVAADASRQRAVPSSEVVDWKDSKAKTMVDRVELMLIATLECDWHRAMNGNAASTRPDRLLGRPQLTAPGEPAPGLDAVCCGSTPGAAEAAASPPRHAQPGRSTSDDQRLHDGITGPR